MNKGLEFIEACFLFGLAADQIEVHHPPAVDYPFHGSLQRWVCARTNGESRHAGAYRTLYCLAAADHNRSP